MERGHRADRAAGTIRVWHHDRDDAARAGDVELRIGQLVEGELFVDEADIDGTSLRTMHRIEPLGGDRIRVVYRLDATGPAAEEIGPAISADFADTIAALVEHAGR